MVRVRIIAVGKLKESFFREAQEEYVKRLRGYIDLEIREINDVPCPEKAVHALEEQVRKKEGETIRGLIRPGEFLVTLDRMGKELTSPEFASFLQERVDFGESTVFIIGGSLGLPEDLLRSARLNLSFSRLTFPHQLFRVMLLEQIYRGCKINNREVYHK